MTGTYDPALNLIYWGTGNPTPVLNGKTRPGDDLYTCSIVALNPDTGKLVVGLPAFAARYARLGRGGDSGAGRCEVSAGKPRKMLMQTSRNGYFFVLDRTTGESLLTTTFGPVNWSTGVDKKGQPIPNPAKEPAPDGRLIAPDEGGLTNYRSPSFDHEDRTVHRRRASQLRHLFRQAGRRQLWLGRRRLWRVGERRCWRRSIIRPARFAGAMSLVRTARARAC